MGMLQHQPSGNEHNLYFCVWNLLSFYITWPFEHAQHKRFASAPYLLRYMHDWEDWIQTVLPTICALAAGTFVLICCACLFLGVGVLDRRD